MKKSKVVYGYATTTYNWDANGGYQTRAYDAPAPCQPNGEEDWELVNTTAVYNPCDQYGTVILIWSWKRSKTQ